MKNEMKNLKETVKILAAKKLESDTLKEEVLQRDAYISRLRHEFLMKGFERYH